jgi:hypothetical protein
MQPLIYFLHTLELLNHKV